MADRHEGFERLLAVWNGSAELAELDSLVVPDYVGHIGSRRRNLAGLKHDLVAYRATAPGVTFQVEDQFRSGDRLATRLVAQLPPSPQGEIATIRGLNMSRWRGRLLAEEWAVWETLPGRG